MNILLETCRGPSRSRYETARTSSVQNSPAYTYAATCRQRKRYSPPTHMGNRGAPGRISPCLRAAESGLSGTAPLPNRSV